MKLETQRLTVRFLQKDDWEDLIRIWEDFNQSDYALYDAPHTLDKAEVHSMTKRWAEVSPQGEHMFFAVCLKGSIIGYADFHKNAEGYECGYCFHSDFHGKGYARESLRALINALSGGHETCFLAGTALNNLPSVRLLQSLGFEKIGEEQVSFHKDKNGKDRFFTGGVFSLVTTETGRTEG